MATGVTGFLLTAIQVLPYALISQYHKDATVSLKALNLTLRFDLEILTLKFDLEFCSGVSRSEWSQRIPVESRIM